MVLWLGLHLVLVMVMVKVVWVLGKPALTPRKFIIGLVVAFLSSQSRDYSSMSHPNKYRSYYLLSLNRDGNFSFSGDGRGCVGPSTTHLSFRKVYLSLDMYVVGFRLSQSHQTEPSIVSSLIRGYSDISTGDY